MSTGPRYWLTHEAHERLQQELDELLGALASDDVDAMWAPAGSGDEPGLAARMRSARIQQIQDILRHAVVGETPPDDGVAEPGMVLTVRFDDTGEVITFLLSVREATDATGLPVYSPHSPLGAAISGAVVGEQRSYTVPSGATVRVSLLEAVPYGQHRQASTSDV